MSSPLRYSERSPASVLKQGAINASTQGHADEYSYIIWPSQARMKFGRQML
jgi:hypothetical protein